jgi:hypothetical protein
MYEGIDTVVLQNELAFEDELPFEWRPSSLPLSPAVQARHAEANVRLLQVCLTLDDPVPTDKADDVQQNAEIARLDMKMNLLLDLVGRLLQQNQPRPVAAKLRLNARGAAWQLANAAHTDAIKEGDAGIFAVYLHDNLLDPLQLTGKVSRLDGERIEVRFDRAPENVAGLIDKLTFRRHRRQIAVKRHPRSK